MPAESRTPKRPRRIGYRSARVKAWVASLALLPLAAAAQDTGWIGHAYENTLAQFAGGQRDAAFTALQELENRAVKGGAGDELVAAEKRVIADIAAHDPQALPALVLLHHDAFLSYRKRQRLQLASHALRMVVEIAASPEMKAADPPVKRVASLSMTSLAGVAVLLNPPDAIELLRRSIELDPLNGDALLALGSIYEKYGNYAEAVDVLQRRAALGPSPEARLRLAVNLRRTGRNAEAEPLLSTLARSSAPEDEWVAILASQELANLLADQNRLGDAVTRLREAAAGHPGNGSLRIQLSYFLDRSGDPAAALDAAEDAAKRVDVADAGPKSTEADPRLVYNRWPKRVFDDADAGMRKAAEPQVPRLAMALGAARGAGG